MTESAEQTIDYSGTAEFEAPDQSSGEKFILFEVAGRVCRVPAVSVLEVVHSLAVSVIPNSPSWLLGLSIFRGEPVAMVQPHAVIKGAARQEATRNFKTIIFRGRDDEAQFALPVDRINEMITVPAPGESEFDDGTTENGGPVMIVDPYGIIEEFAEGGR